MITIPLKGLKFEGRNIFDTHFIIGHAELVKFENADEMYLVCTVKKYFPPEMSFHQGYLIVIQFRKEEKKGDMGEIMVLNEDITCEYFQVVKVGKKNFIIYSVHTDGSVQVTSLNKINKQHIEEELTYIRECEEVENQPDSGDKKIGENIEVVKKSISKQIKLEALIASKGLNSAYGFREGS